MHVEGKTENESLVSSSNESKKEEGFCFQEQTEEKSPLSSWTPGGEVINEGNESTAPSSQEEKILEAISTVYDPEIPVNVYELGLIYAIDIYENGKVKIEMTLTAPGCPSAQELPVQIKEAVEKLEMFKEVEVEVVWDPPWDMSRMSEDARLALNMF